MTCPVCRSDVSIHSFLEATGLSGIVCPQCNSSLWPTRLSYYVLMFAAVLPCEALLSYMRSLHANFFVSLAVFSVLLLGMFTLLAPWVLKLQPKESSILKLNHR